MNDEVGGWEIARDRKAWFHRLAIQQKLVVVPAQAGVDGPVFQTDLIFDEGRLLEVGTVGDEAEVRRGVGIELDGIGDVVAEVLVQK